MSIQEPHTVIDGFCPICQKDVTFTAQTSWLRDWLNCPGCGSVPRDRALALILNEVCPDWAQKRIHESSPEPRGISLRMSQGVPGYTATQFYPDIPLGDNSRGFRNENLESLTFADNSFDIFVGLDVMEHVNYPERVFAEARRTLVPGGICIFTTPTYKQRTQTERRAMYRDDGSVNFMGFEPEYHGNPVSDSGALVTFHYGYDLPDLIGQWSGMDTRVCRFHDRRHGILGEFTEVYLCVNRK